MAAQHPQYTVLVNSTVVSRRPITTKYMGR